MKGFAVGLVTKRVWWRSLAVGACLGSLVAVSAMAAVPAVPSRIRQAAAQIFGEGKPTIKHEYEGGVDLYELAAPAQLEVILDARGAVTEIEVKIPVGLVPPALLARAREVLPRGARVTEAELLVRGAKLLYEIEARNADTEIEVVLDGEGTVVSQQTEQDDGGGED